MLKKSGEENRKEVNTRRQRTNMRKQMLKKGRKRNDKCERSERMKNTTKRS